MPIVTLTTDLGTKDHYIGAIKGALLCIDPTLNIIDINHNIELFNIVQAAYILKNTYKNFPKDSIHFIGVNGFYKSYPRFLAIRYEEQYFVAPDNGVLSLLTNNNYKEVYEIPYFTLSTFPYPEVFCWVVKHITSKKEWNTIGKTVDKIIERINFQPVIKKDQIKGSVIHIDHYENVVLNITRPLFDRVARNRSFQLFYKRNNPITELSKLYNEVPIGEITCLFNSADYLEITVNMGKAASLLGLKIDSPIQIDF